jgi:hypothetical protein
MLDILMFFRNNSNKKQSDKFINLYGFRFDLINMFIFLVVMLVFGFLVFDQEENRF